MIKEVNVSALVVFFVAAALAACASILGIEDLPETCGDSVRSPGEACDDGNTVSGDGCSATCTSNETCGNSVRDPGEVCDEGGNSPECDSDCSVAVCGDAFVNSEAGERCEDGNSVAGDGCADCRLECGNGLLEAGELCDGGDANDDGHADDTSICDGDCTVPSCGDGYANSVTEECDDGNALNVDDCLNECQYATCGDGFVRSGIEECDDGNAVNTDDCPDGVGGTCQAARCGDGFRDQQGPVTEACDDGNDHTGDGCHMCVID